MSNKILMSHLFKSPIRNIMHKIFYELGYFKRCHEKIMHIVLQKLNLMHIVDHVFVDLK